MPKRKRWQPTIGDLVGIAGFALAVIVWLTQPSWEIGGVGATVAIALIVFAAIRHDSRALWRSIIAAVAILGFVAAIWKPLWNSFHKDYPRITFNWPVTLNGPLPAANDPPDAPPLNLPGPALSKWGKMMYMCPFPPNVNPHDAETAKEQVRRNAEVFGKALGVDLVLTDIPYGVRFDVTANDSNGQARMQAIQRYTVQLERTGSGIFVTFTMDFTGAMAILSQVPTDRGSEYEKPFDNAVEQLGFPPGKCRML
jgi:hypothetical protein